MQENDSYYKNCCTTVSILEVLNTIHEKQGEEFPILVRFGYIDHNGKKTWKSGLITGILDNGDEVYIDAETNDSFNMKG